MVCVFGMQSIYAQTIVTGTITDADDGIPLPNVNVIVKGTTHGVSADFDGNYSIELTDANVVLHFSFVGYTDKDISVNGRSVINVALDASAESLDEVVVTALGIKKEQRALGYAVSAVSSEELTLASNPNVMTSLYGKAAGVQIKSNPGGATAGVKVVIRGNNSITGFNQPLFIVDGIPIEHGDSEYNRWGGSDPGNGANDINPEDVESMTILKGANASALYGSKAANGVVIITTKSGKGIADGRIGVSFNSSTTIDKVAYLPDYQNQYGSGFDSQVFRKNTEGEDIYHNTWPSFGPKMEGQMLRWWDGEMRPYSPQPNNISDIFTTGHTFTNNVAISKNVPGKFSFRLGYTNTDYKGTYPGVEQKRNVYSINTKVDLTSKLDVTLVANYYDIYTKNRPYRLSGLAGYEYPRSTKYELVQQNYKQEGYFNGEISGDRAPGMVRNMMGMLWEANENSRVDDKGRLIGNITFNYRAFEGFNIRGRMGTDVTNTDYVTEEASKQPVNSGAFKIGKRKTTLDYMELILTYNTNLGKNFSLNTLIGGSISQEKALFNNANTAGGLIVPNWFSLNNSVNAKQGSGGRYSERSDGVFGVLGLVYKNMIYLDITGRNDWSSTLPPKNNSYFYPSVSTSFVFTELMESNWLNFGKVRASYAHTGNDAKRYQANKNYNYGSFWGATTNSFSGNVPPISLLPEDQVSLEFGAELKMFNNRLGVDFTWYHNQNKDLIMDLAVAPSSSSSGVTTNVGQMDNSGFELQLYGTILKSDNFSWDATINLAKNTNEVISLAPGITQFPVGGNIGSAIRNQAKVGEPFGDWIAYVYERDDAGNKVVDSDGLYVRDDSEYVSIGNSTPDFYGGMSNMIRYKNLSFTANIDFSIGGDMFSFTNYYGMNAGKLKESLKYRDEANGGLPYYKDSDGVITPLPDHSSPAPGGAVVYHDGVILEGVTEGGAANAKMIDAFDYYINTFYWNYGFHEEGLFDNSYIKMREMALTYQLDRKYTKRMGIQDFSISLIGRNLFYIYKNIPNIDPESATGTQSGEASAFEYGGQPGTKTYGVSLRINF